MKMTTLLLLIGCLHVNAGAIAQITFSAKDVPLKQVFAAVEKQTGYVVFFNQADLKKARNITISAKNMPVAEFMTECLKGQPLEFNIESKTIFISLRQNGEAGKNASAVTDTIPRVPVTGRVMLQDSSNTVLENVNVVNLATNEGTTTGANGVFTIMARKGDVLEFSYVGIVSRRLTINRPDNVVAISLARNIKEEEMVTVYNTGYESLPKERATGSFVKMNNELVNYRVSTNILDRLNGLANSVYVDNRTNTSKITIRGISTIFSDTDPLIVLDNFPYEGDLNNINPNDVEDITILRDAAAASIWGARAGNGVIVITTKKAKYGQPIHLSIKNNVTIMEKPDLYYFPQMSSSDFIDIEQFLFEKNFYNSAINNTTSRPILSPVVEILRKKRSGLISDAEAEAQINALRSIDVRKDFEKYVYRNAASQQHSIELGGGATNITYRLSVGYDRNLNQQVGDQYERFTVRTSSTMQPMRNLEIGASIQYALSNRQNNGLRYPLVPGGGKSALYPYARLADQNGNPLYVEKDYRIGYIDTAGAGKLLDWHYSPLEEIDLANNTNGFQDVLLNFHLKYKITPAFNGELMYQMEKTKGTNREHYSEETYFARNLINRFTQIDGNTITRIIPLGGILDLRESELTSHSVRGQLNYNKSWKGGDHDLIALGGVELRQNHNISSSSRTYGYNENKLTYSNVDYVNRYPIYGRLSSNQTVPSTVGFGDLLDRFISLFGNIAYTYKSRYTLSASSRKDAANIFGVNTNDKWKPLWSVGASWNISSEKFFGVNWLHYLRLRTTYGYSGNINNSKSAFATISYYLFPDSYTNLPFANINNPPNLNLRWEEVRTLNIGIDFSAFKQRISGSIEYYQKKSKDLIAPAPLDPTTGILSLDINSAHIGGKGVDVHLNSINLNGKFKWQTTVLFSYSENKITRYLRSASTAKSYVGNGLSINPYEGKHAYAMFSYAWAGLDANGNPQGLLDKQVSTDYSAILNAPISNLVYHGSAQPLYFGAIGNIFAWRAITFTIFFRYSFDYYFRRNTIRYSSLFSSWSNPHADFNRRWMQPGDETHTTVPSMIYPANSNRDDFYSNSEATIEKGDHIRLQDIRITYDFNKSVFNRFPFSKVQLYVYANNIGIVWRSNQAGLDPDYASEIYPAPRTLAIGLNVSF